jgi:hypothetical protein
VTIGFAFVLHIIIKHQHRSYTSLNGLQTFSPANSENNENGCVPLEVLIDYRCESFDFDRLVPQTDATFHYDKFNRLRLRNNVTSVTRTAHHEPLLAHHSHLSNETVGCSQMTWLIKINSVFRILSKSMFHGSLSQRATCTSKTFRTSSRN